MKPSEAIVELLNLEAMAIQHRERCREPECGVSVYVARMTAMRLAEAVPDDEKRQAREILDRWPV